MSTHLGQKLPSGGIGGLGLSEYSSVTGNTARPSGFASPTRSFDDRGASMVEFALIMPLLVVLLFGIFEFGFVFGQHLDVRHAAREGGRLAVVNFDNENTEGAAQSAAIVEAVCSRMALASDATVGLSSPQGAEPEFGDFVEVTVSADVNQITGFFAPVLDEVTLNSTVEMRLELDATYELPHSGVCT